MSTLTLLHVVISFVGILSGFVVAYGLLTSQRFRGWTALFILATAATSVTGFIFFPFHQLLPSHKVGIISLVTLALASYALYRRHLTGPWRWLYVLAAMLSFYLNFFVLIVQCFLKIPALKALAPTQTEPPFLITQGVAFALFLAATIAATIRFRPEPAAAA
jgi:hypothetical protein